MLPAEFSEEISMENRVVVQSRIPDPRSHFFFIPDSRIRDSGWWIGGSILELFRIPSFSGISLRITEFSTLGLGLGLGLG